MQGDGKMIQYLNQILVNELTAINQYFLHSRMCQNWGFQGLGKKIYEESIEEMRHADALIKRVLFLEGLPNLQALGKLMIGEDVPEVLRSDLALERNGHPLCKEAIAYAESIGDYVSRLLIQDILEDEEEHIDWLETQLGLLDKLGLENYLQSQLRDSQ